MNRKDKFTVLITPLGLFYVKHDVYRKELNISNKWSGEQNYCDDEDCSGDCPKCPKVDTMPDHEIRLGRKKFDVDITARYGKTKKKGIYATRLWMHAQGASKKNQTGVSPDDGKLLEIAIYPAIHDMIKLEQEFIADGCIDTITQRCKWDMEKIEQLKAQTAKLEATVANKMAATKELSLIRSAHKRIRVKAEAAAAKAAGIPEPAAVPELTPTVEVVTEAVVEVTNEG